ncbi:hypothetical protein BJX68DRAFT_51318 [Aspergillus pseudodeflectus]|uniref:Cytochrome b561 domain-containing protein n=1 Tax=Aspergillus pseudodeflectus TaxID=176178 RepID=A0ABR4KPE4_9EURO
MSDSSGLTAAGGASYTSNTLHVGDGTWDLDRDTFLLPNLMGVNFETMRYNGMGNRFRDMPHYHTLIIAHGVIAAIVFLGLVPLSIFLVRYYSLRNPYSAFRYHVWCQVLTLFLSTVIFVLGWFAVGPARSLTNPHHGIGLAIYVMIVFQVFWGWFVHKIERNKKRFHVPLKLVIHRWIGRGLAILGIVQIPLGLTLYGSPKSLFILYAVAAFILLLTFFILSYRYDSDRGSGPDGDDSRYSYVSRPPDDDHGHGGFGRMAAAGAAGAGLAAIFRRRNRDHVSDGSHTSYMDEKYSDEGSRRGGGWGGRFLKIGALGGGALLAKRFFDRRRERESDAESGRYRPAHRRTDSMTEESLSRLDDRPPPGPGSGPGPSYPAPLNRPSGGPPSRPQSPGSSYYDYSYLSREDEGRSSHPVRNAFLGAGAFAAVKGLFSRKKKDEQRHVEEMRRHDLENEKLARANSKRRYPGDGYLPQRKRPASQTATDVSTDLTPRPHRHPYAPESGLSALPVASGAVDGAHGTMPPAPPIHYDPASTMTPTPASAPPPPQPHIESAIATAPMAAAGPSTDHLPPPGSGTWQREDHVESPPVSLKMKMHDDGRHITLRRLTEEEAAASRDARRRERRNSRRRNGSVSSLSGNEGTGSRDRWRRVEELERQQHEQMLREQAAASAAAAGAAAATASPPPLAQPPLATGPTASGTIPTAASSFLPPQSTSHLPPPRAPSTNPYGSITSPTYTDTNASEYASNRRRRRAERARARQERQQHPSVEFT